MFFGVEALQGMIQGWRLTKHERELEGSRDALIEARTLDHCIASASFWVRCGAVECLLGWFAELCERPLIVLVPPGETPRAPLPRGAATLTVWDEILYDAKVDVHLAPRPIDFYSPAEDVLAQAIERETGLEVTVTPLEWRVQLRKPHAVDELLVVQDRALTTALLTARRRARRRGLGHARASVIDVTPPSGEDAGRPSLPVPDER
jgi:hypothetical protein